MTNDLLNTLTEIRHDLHAHPQIAFQETYASECVQSFLAERDIPFVAGIGKTGVVGWISPTNDEVATHDQTSGGGVALRADMDALPMQEQTDLPYRSQFDGAMHACGHDGHTTMLLGAAAVLNEQRDKLTQPVKLFFQPAEENGGGATRLIGAGALTEQIGGFAVTNVFGIHNWPSVAVGDLLIGQGPVLAGTDLFTLTLCGTGGHAAMPQFACDLNIAASALMQALNTIISRNVPPHEAAVLSVAGLEGGKAHNVLPGEVKLLGTIRYFNQSIREQLIDRINQCCDGMGTAYGCAITCNIEDGYPPTVNDAAFADEVSTIATNIGLNQVTHPPATVSEDFAFYAQHVPSVFVGLGADSPDREDENLPLHHDRYDFNDALIPLGVKLMCAVAFGEGG